MIFTILVGFVALVAVLAFVFAVWLLFLQPEDAIFPVIGGAITALIPTIIVCMSWTDQARDLGVIIAQSEVVAVYEERVGSLSDRLNTMDYPKGSTFNADTPVAAIVLSLTEAEKELAKAKAARAKAIVRIEQRRAGPMSHVIKWAGDYK